MVSSRSRGIELQQPDGAQNHVSNLRTAGKRITDGEDGHVPLEAVDAHAGNSQDFLHRYLLAAHDAVQQGPQAVRALGPNLLDWIADARNLRLAWDYLAHNGGQAPGPNGRRFSDIENQETWECTCAAIGRAIQTGSYHPGPVRNEEYSQSARDVATAR